MLDRQRPRCSRSGRHLLPGRRAVEPPRAGGGGGTAAGGSGTSGGGAAGTSGAAGTGARRRRAGTTGAAGSGGAAAGNDGRGRRRWRRRGDERRGRNGRQPVDRGAGAGGRRLAAPARAVRAAGGGAGGGAGAPGAAGGGGTAGGGPSRHARSSSRRTAAGAGSRSPRALFYGTRLIVGSVSSGWSNAAIRGNVRALVYDFGAAHDHHHRAAHPAGARRSRLAGVPGPPRRTPADALRQARLREPLLLPDLADRRRPDLGRRADLRAERDHQPHLQQHLHAVRRGEPHLRLLPGPRRQLQAVLRVLRRLGPDLDERQRRHPGPLHGRRCSAPTSATCRTARTPSTSSTARATRATSTPASITSTTRAGSLYRSDGTRIAALTAGLAVPTQGTRIFQADSQHVAWASDVVLDPQSASGRHLLGPGRLGRSAGRPGRRRHSLPLRALGRHGLAGLRRSPTPARASTRARTTTAASPRWIPATCRSSTSRPTPTRRPACRS